MPKVVVTAQLGEVAGIILGMVGIITNMVILE